MKYYKATPNGKIPLTTEEVAKFKAIEAKWDSESNDRAAAEVREKRDATLSSCDWTQVSDAPVDQEAWAIYRQALRDIPSQEGFPAEVTWPVAP